MQEHATSTERPRVRALDGLRGIALLLVFGDHLIAASWTGGLIPAPYASGLDRAAFRAIGSGWAGVDLFFVLSGFLITGILLDAKDKVAFFRNFYARRFLRIFPLYYGFLAAALLIVVLIPGSHNPLYALNNLPERHWWFWTYLMNVPLSLSSFGAGDEFPVPHLWSLAIEEQFYVVWPCVVLFCTRRQLVAVSIATAVASLGFRVYLAEVEPSFAHSFTAYFSTPGRVEPLAIGSLIACLAKGEPGLSAAARPALAAGFLTLVILVVLGLQSNGLNPGDPYISTIGFSALAVFFGALIVLLSQNGSWSARLFSNAALVSAGKYSYALYVFHPLVIALVIRRLVVTGGVPVIAGSYLPALAVVSVLTFVPSFAAAWLSWHLYEVRFLKLKRYFSPEGAAPPPVPAPQAPTAAAPAAALLGE